MGLFDIFRVSSIKQENEELKKQIENLQERINALGVTEYEQAKKILDNQAKEIVQNNASIARLRKEIEEKISGIQVNGLSLFFLKHVRWPDAKRYIKV